MIKSNYHSHCTFCDGRGEPNDFIRSALYNEFQIYGFSSHSPLPFSTFWNMSAQDMPAYLAEIARLKEKHSNEITIYTGLEIDYLDATYNPSIPYFKELPLDYRIGSIHFLPLSKKLSKSKLACIDGKFDEFEKVVIAHFGGDIRNIVRRFFDTTICMIEAGGFDIVGHLDKIYMNASQYDGFSLGADWYQKPFQECLKLIAEKDLIVEINTKNLLSKKQIFPHLNSLPLLHAMHIPIVVNTDCHFPDSIESGREEAFDLLRNIGFRTTRELIDGKWQDVGF